MEKQSEEIESPTLTIVNPSAKPSKGQKDFNIYLLDNMQYFEGYTCIRRYKGVVLFFLR